MRLAARQTSGAVADLRPRFGLLAAMLAGLAGVSAFLLTQAPDRRELAAECRAIAQVALVLGAHTVEPAVGGRMGGVPVDCSTALSAAGLRLTGSPADRAVVVFDRPRRIEADRMIVDYGVVCGPLCGQGYRAELIRRNGRWEVVARSETWIS